MRTLPFAEWRMCANGTWSVLRVRVSGGIGFRLGAVNVDRFSRPCYWSQSGHVVVQCREIRAVPGEQGIEVYNYMIPRTRLVLTTGPFGAGGNAWEAPAS